MEFLEDIKVCAKTDTGLKRGNNQDSHLIIDNTKKDYDTMSFGFLFAIADGISGNAAGGKASSVACEGLLEYYTEKSIVTDWPSNSVSRLKVLENVIRRADKEVNGYAERNKEFRGMGTTLSVLVLKGSVALIAHVGDTRIYRLRDNFLDQLTEDHTMAQLSVEMGYLGQKEATKHPLRHMLTEAIGQGLDEIQTRTEKVKEGDIFLLCSDGLHHMVSDDEIKNLLSDSPAHCSVCDRLVESALNHGGEDNVTVIVVQV